MAKNKLTKEGFDKINSELGELKNTKRPVAVDRLQKARAMGDLSENSEYVAAKEDLEILDERIQEIEVLLADVEIIESSNTPTEVVEIGTKVSVRINGSDDVFYIVGEFEADPANKKVSYTSPLGQALMGKKVGEVTSFDAPAGKKEYTILDIKNN